MAMAEMRVPEMTLGDRLRLARMKARIGIKEMADLVGCSPAAVSQWERDEKQPRELLRVVGTWSEATRVPQSWLLLGSTTDRYGDSPDEGPFLSPLDGVDLTDPTQLSLSLRPEFTVLS